MRDCTRIDASSWISKLGSKALITFDYLKYPKPVIDKQKGTITSYVKPIYGKRHFDLPIEKRVEPLNYDSLSKTIT